MTQINFNDLPTDIKSLIFNHQVFKRHRTREHIQRRKFKLYFDECIYDIYKSSKNTNSPAEMLINIKLNNEWTFEDEYAMMDNDPHYIPEPQDDWF